MRDERLFQLFEEIDSLTGIGPKLKPVFEHLVGGTHVWDVLLHLPERWLDRRVRDSFQDIVPGEVATVRGEVQSITSPHTDKAPHKVVLFDGTGFLTLTYFRADSRWLKSQFPIGSERIVSGAVSEYAGERQMAHPDYAVDAKSNDLPPAVEPIYALTAGLTNKRFHTSAIAALERVPHDLGEWIDAELVSRRGWPTMREALAGLHAPKEYAEDRFALCRARLAYDEALSREITFSLARKARLTRSGPTIPPSPKRQNQLASTLPYKLTGAQIRATREISDDMQTPSPMRRMLQGDVGAGKTLVAAMAAIQAMEAGYQVAVMAPTEVLARQQYETLSSLLTPLGYVVGALTGRDKGAARDGTLLGLVDGSIQLVCGTQALFQKTIQFRSLGLIIVDEQHRFGVADRMRLAGKSASPHILVMSATPIPRTLALAVNGDMEVSVLDEKPVGRLPIETRAIPDTRIEDVVEAIGRAIKRGERAFWVCPRVDAEDAGAAVHRANALRRDLNADVGLVHGRLKPAEKDQALEDFRSGKSSILVATTVIEVGVDVPEATIMVIENTESFGLAQLHQLRGRVGRSDRQSYCLLLYKPPLGETARARIDVLRNTEDGFEIADADFRLRGPGDLLGLRQSGSIDFRVLDLARDSDLVDIARQDARFQVERDPDFTTPRGGAMRLLRQLFAPTVSFRDE